MVAVLFVCLGNICRSPAAEAILRQMAKEHNIDLVISSCGTGDWNIGELSDERMVRAAQIRGISISKRAEQFQPQFFEQYDYILASDAKVIAELHYHIKNPAHKSKISLMTAFSKAYPNVDIPDPYYSNGFDEVINILEDACEGFLEHIRSKK